MFHPVVPKRSAEALFAFISFSCLGAAQGFDNAWLTFTNADSRIVADSVVGAGDTQEKDYAHADFDRDGWVDLVCVRKQPNHTTGRRTNVLFMNETGMLVDRTALYAAASDVVQDFGFLTETNDRDVVAVDVDNDGWVDVVTATTLTPNQPKHVSHPRVYLNLGEDANGDWLGFRYEDARIPQLLLQNGTPSWPRFTAMDAGDVTGDGFADLYFGDNDKVPGLGGGDMNDRLLVNDGTGHFIDMSSVALTASMLNAGYTTAVVVVDVNQDNHADVVRDRGGTLSVVHNDPGNVGTFANLETNPTGSPYYVSVGDLNQDDLPDLVISDNGPDNVRYNQGPNMSGGTQWSAPSNFSFLTGGDDGFGSDSYVVDLDDDGWNDVVITDYDIELAGCNRRTHIYHNAGGVVGGTVTLREEAGSAGSNWRGAVGLLASDLRGTHDAAFFDLDNDGDLDMVLGRCTGTFVWLNQTQPTPSTIGTPYCATSPNSVDPVGAIITVTGTTSVALNSLMLAAGPIEMGQPGVFYYGPTALAGVPFGDGNRCVGGASGTVVRVYPFTFANQLGNQTVIINNTLPAHAQITPGATLNFQCWYRDPAAGLSGFNLSNGVSITFEP